ncbi:Inactive disease susceptibility protein LOV1 [Frankliniella fusca]|uniref:Inactive disease susceptibility protein LOV1 n=1 Tax=Frankliniella fusca TaxID=407009 RepID=A0AAE1H039_9NEOP|nr:Inactive disease susceptibility protein LOV1 [Frankliniella fusca]
MQAHQRRRPRQCTANAVAGACKASAVNPRLWTSQTIDECLMTGNRLFELSYELLPSTFNHLYLRPDELYSTLSFPENEITFQVEINEVFDGTSINSIATVSNDGPTNYCLHDAILCFFHNFQYGIFTCQVESIAVMKVDNEYYVFDSHKRCKNGLRDGANGTAVQVCFTDINELIIHLKAFRCCSAPTAVCDSCQFSISPLLINSVTNITCHALSSATETSNVSNKRVSQLELARNAKKNKKSNKLLQNNKKVPARKQIIVDNEIPSSSTEQLLDKISDLRIRPTQVKYERTPEMRAKNVEQICKRYNTDDIVKETKVKQVREKYQNDRSFKESHGKKMKEKMHEKYNTDECFKLSQSKIMQEKMREKYNTDESFKISHSKKMQEKMKEKYNTNDSFNISHNTNMKQKYQSDTNRRSSGVPYYHNKLLSNVKNSYQSLQGTKRKLNYQNLYHASKKTKISLQERFNEQKKEMPTIICTCCAQLFFKKSTVHELTLKTDTSLRISDVCIYRSHLQENESGNVCSTCANHLKKGKVPHFAVVNGLLFEPLPEELTGLTTLEERLVSARIPFMQIRELGYQKQLGLKGNCVNVPIDINKTVTCLPRMDSEDDTLLVQLMRRMNEEDDLTDQQETLLTSGFVADSGIKIAPDEDMDVLAFPTVYGGKQRIFKVKNLYRDKNGPFHPYEVDNDFFRIELQFRELTEVIARTDEDCTFDEYLAYLNIDEQSYMMALRSKL